MKQQLTPDMSLDEVTPIELLPLGLEAPVVTPNGHFSFNNCCHYCAAAADRATTDQAPGALEIRSTVLWHCTLRQSGIMHKAAQTDFARS